MIEKQINENIEVLKKKKDRIKENEKNLGKFVPGAEVKVFDNRLNEWRSAKVQFVEGKKVKVRYRRNQAEDALLELKLLEQQESDMNIEAIIQTEDYFQLQDIQLVEEKLTLLEEKPNRKENKTKDSKENRKKEDKIKNSRNRERSREKKVGRSRKERQHKSSRKKESFRDRERSRYRDRRRSRERNRRRSKDIRSRDKNRNKRKYPSSSSSSSSSSSNSSSSSSSSSSTSKNKNQNIQKKKQLEIEKKKRDQDLSNLYGKNQPETKQTTERLNSKILDEGLNKIE